ncbi:MAG: M20/M25/M40 family metallo-hydrolase [Armatimonadetes bacterium]|nr:M20/M25/M40 family metallo-hydrolase [Armatimonadota bacterium]
MTSRRALLVVVAGLSLPVWAQYPGAAPVPSPWKTGFESIQERDARSILGFLAGPDFLGRNALTADFQLAAGACAQMFREMGALPAGENGSYFQRLTLETTTAVPEQTGLSSADGKWSVPYGVDFQTGAFDSGSRRFRLAFVSGPASGGASGLDWAQVRGAMIVLSPTASRNPEIRDKTANAVLGLGALGVLTPRAGRADARNSAQHVPGAEDPRRGPLPGFLLSPKSAAELAQRSGAKGYLQEEQGSAAIELSEELEVKVAVTKTGQDTVNVVAKVPGSDPKLKGECVLVGAHLDHMGVSSDGVRYGADDNASGSTAALLLTRALLKNPVKPKRTVVVALWSMEERGTWGSLNYSEKPHMPIKDTVAYVNMDMVGRNENSGPDIPEFNTRAVYPGIVNLNSPDFERILVDANRYVGLDLRQDKEDRTERSDTRNFVFRGVPTVKVFTGEHEDYHRTGDTPDKVNYAKALNVTKWIYLTVQRLASDAARPKFERHPFVAPKDVRVSGYATLAEGSFPAGSVLRVTVEDTARADAKATVLAKSEHPAVGNRVPFQALVPRSSLTAETRAVVRLQVFDKGQLVATTDTADSLPPAGWPRAKTIALKRVP